MVGKRLVCELDNGVYDSQLEFLYSQPSVSEQRERYKRLLEKHMLWQGDSAEVFFCSAPGRTEIGGNHTDHQRGRVLAAAVTLDTLAAVTPLDELVVELDSQGYGTISVDISSLDIDPVEKGSPAALIRGVAAGMAERGIKLRGFCASVTSAVCSGSGISSSAAFEVLLATIFNELNTNDYKLSPVEIAIVCQRAENEYFGKPCGLLDQCSSAVGGFVTIDFENPKNPLVERIDVDMASHGYTLCLVNTGGSHENLTEEYAAIPREMKQVAELFGQTELRGLTEQDLISTLHVLRNKVSDRAILRSFHFVGEDERAVLQADALKRGHFAKFLQLIRESGASSEKFLQNLFPVSITQERSLCLGQLLTERSLGGSGAWRVHGGGFAGTLQVFLPMARLDSYARAMERVFGAGSVYKLTIRPVGGSCIAFE